MRSFLRGVVYLVPAIWASMLAADGRHVQGASPDDGGETAVIVVKSVRPEGLPSSDPVVYGLTRNDYHRIVTQIPDLRRTIPVREVPEWIRYGSRSDKGPLIGTTEAFAGAYGVEVARGRFLTEKDLKRLGNVAVDNAQLAAAEARAELVTAQGARQLLTEHLRGHRTAALELAVLQTKSTLTQIQSQSALVLENARANILASKAALELEDVKLAAASKQIEGCRIYAPRDGLVIFARTITPGTDAIAKGAVVRQRQLLLTMPDMSRLQARLSVHESRIDRVRKGQPVRMEFDAFPDRAFHGTVTQISGSPEPRNSWIADVKTYAVLVSLEDAAAELKLGMTALAEIDVSQPGRE